MRKAQKQEILEMFKILQEAHEQIKDSIQRKNVAAAKDMLVQCQEFAVNIGNAIETMEGEDCVIIPYLQGYCEMVYQGFIALTDDAECSSDTLYKSLQQQLFQIENRVRQDISVRREVVFFPYKASMWDSLESVYLAEKEDPACDVYCVPIPYYDRNSDGSLGQMHYEGKEYPKNIEVTDWNTYHFEARKPDAIYIHNPYDNWNMVTCVHPRFFSGNLKKYTEQLVYIPYFVLPEIEPDDQERIDGIKHFCFLPAVMNADKVIVQSEKIKQIYVNEYLKEAQTNQLTGRHIDRRYLEEKIQGLGSPKFDKVKNTKKEELEIPEEWLKIIRNPDGSWKKVIFYNTSLAALLKHNEKMLEKMRAVFRIFKENKDEVILLWRPHPLIKSTVSAMRPQLWIEYEKLVNQYRREGWGIYDDSSDVDRAVVVSDAYYGDSSSIVQLYQQTGKPVMLQNVNTDNNDNKRKLMIEDAILFENEVWFYSIQLNHLFAVSIVTKEITFCDKLPTMQSDRTRLFASMKIVDKKIYFVPFYERKIVVFDIESRKFESINLNHRAFEPEKYAPAFMGVEAYHKHLYIFPVFSNVIICLNTENNEIEYLTEWVSQVKEYVFDWKDAFFRRQVMRKDNKMYIPFCNANAVLELDCDTNQTVVYKLGEQTIGYSGICFDGQDFWLSPRKNGKIVKWNLNTADIVMIDANLQNRKEAYLGIFFTGDTIYCFSDKHKKKIIVNSGKIIEEPGIYFFAKEDSEVLYSYRIDTGILEMIDKAENKKKEIEIVADDEYMNHCMVEKMKIECVIECDEMKLNHLLEASHF